MPVYLDGCARFVTERAVFINEFEVERELCDTDEFACRFLPGAPNFLCADGIHFGGPSGAARATP